MIVGNNNDHLSSPAVQQIARTCERKSEKKKNYTRYLVGKGPIVK